MKIAFFVFLCTAHSIFGQVSQDQCKIVTGKIINLIESDNIEEITEFFSQNRDFVLPVLEDIKLEINSFKSKTISKIIPVVSKDNFIYRWIKLNDDGQIVLKVDFYFDRKQERAFVSKLEVRKKSDFNGRKSFKKNGKKPSAFPPPPSKDSN